MGSQTKYATVVTGNTGGDAVWTLVGGADFVECLGATSDTDTCAESFIDSDPGGENNHGGTRKLKLAGFGFTIPAGATNLLASAALTARSSAGLDAVGFLGGGSTYQARLYETASGSGNNAYGGANNMRSGDYVAIAGTGGAPTAFAPFTLASFTNPSFLTIARANAAGLTLEFGVADNTVDPETPTNATVQMYGVALTITYDDPPAGVVAAAAGAAHRMLAMGLLAMQRAVLRVRGLFAPPVLAHGGSL